MLKPNTQELTIKNTIVEDILSDDTKTEFNKIEEIENLVYRAKQYTYIFKNFQTEKAFCRDICNGEITLKEGDEEQSNLLIEIVVLKKKTKPQDPEKKQEKKEIFKNLYTLFKARERVLDVFEHKIFPVKTKGLGF